MIEGVEDLVADRQRVFLVVWNGQVLVQRGIEICVPRTMEAATRHVAEQASYICAAHNYARFSKRRQVCTRISSMCVAGLEWTDAGLIGPVEVAERRSDVRVVLAIQWSRDCPGLVNQSTSQLPATDQQIHKLVV